MARILRAMLGHLYLERDPFDIGPGRLYYSSKYAPRYASAEESLIADAEKLFQDLCRAAGRVYRHA